MFSIINAILIMSDIKLDLNLKCLSGSQWDEECNMCAMVWIEGNQGTKKGGAGDELMLSTFLLKVSALFTKIIWCHSKCS